MDTDAQEYWQDLQRQGELLHSRLGELFESKAVRLHTSALRIPNTPEAKLAQYLHLLQTRHPLFTLGTDQHYKLRRNRAIAKFCIQSDDFPEKFFESWITRNNEVGLGLDQLTDRKRKQLKDAIITGQQKRLKQWIKYINAESSGYPIWFRFYVLSNIVKLKEYDTKKGKFPRRSSSSTSNFPELNPDVIADIYRHITDPEFHSAKKIDLSRQYFKMETRDQHSELPPMDANFARLYEFWTHDFLRRVTDKDLDETSGVWIKYEQGDFAQDVTRSVSGYNTGWCVANFGQSDLFLKHGDIFIYYTPISTGEVVVPRLIIRMENQTVIEVRGRGQHQEIEPQLLEIAKEKLLELPGGDQYFGRVADMNQLTEIVLKDQEGQILTREDLTFLYEIEKPITSFGMKRDPRIESLLNSRDPQKDLAFLFACEPEQVALSPEDINFETVVCRFNIDRKTPLELDSYPNVIAVVGEANFERMPNRFPKVTFVSGSAQPGNHMSELCVVGDRLIFSNSYRGLEHLIKVGSSALLSSSKGDFPNLESVGGDLIANYSAASFPALRHVGGDLRIEGNRIDWLAEDLVVEGRIFGKMPMTKSQFQENPLVL